MRWLAASLLLLLIPNAAAVEFGAPATSNGDAQISGSGWIVLALAPGDQLEAVLPQGDVQIHEIVRTQVSFGADRVEWTQSLPSRTESWDRQVVSVDGALFAVFEAHDVIVDTRGLVVLETNGHHLMADHRREFEAWGPIALLPDRQVAAVQILEGYELSAQTDSSFWRGASCAACPTDRREGATTWAAGTYVTQSLPLQVRGTGDLWLLGDGWNLTVSGVARLPGASTHQNQTLTVDGNTSLSGVSWVGPARLGADLVEAEGTLFVDETGLDAVAPVAAVAGVGVGIFLAFLVAREILAAPLKNERREMIHELVRANPGIQQSDIVQRSGMGTGAVVYALRVLEQSGLLRSQKLHGRKVYFAPDQEVNHLALLEQAFGRERVRLALAFMAESSTKSVVVHRLIGEGLSRAAAYRLVRAIEQAPVELRTSQPDVGVPA